MPIALATIAGVGACGPLGLDALQLAACARAGQLELRATPFRDRRGRPISAAVTDALPADLVGFERLIELGVPALVEAAGTASAAPPLVLCLPERDRPGDDPRLASEMVPALSHASGVPIDLGRSRIVRSGHASGAIAFEAALALLHDVPAVLVGGIDSHYHPELLAWLDDDDRLAAREDSEGGILPSEAAAFVLLARGGVASSAALVASAWAREDPNEEIGTTLARLVARAAEPAGGVRWLLTDLSGEAHRSEEWTHAVVEIGLAEPVPRHDTVYLLGDVGAASGAVLTVIATTWWRLGCAPAASAVVVLRSEGPERGAFLLQAT